MFGKPKNEMIIGNWEEPGVIGTRVEIDNREICILWRNEVVLKCKYKAKKDGEKVVIIPNTKDLQYESSNTPYATIEEIYFEGDTITITKSFSVTGLSKEVLKKTTNSRYGNYDIVDELLKELNGSWVCERMGETFTIKGNTLLTNNKSEKIHVLKSRSNGEIKVVNENPARKEILYYMNFTYDGNSLHTYIPVCDAKPIILDFKKSE